jgi:thiopurine S-methyltransferase
MQHIFWLDRWELNQIGFHNSEVNQHLQQNWDLLKLPPNSKVFVPFCGKSLDLLWLRQRNHHVIGVELSSIAVRAFFAENQSPYTVEQKGEFEVFEADGIQIYCGDFFKLPSDVLCDVKAVYDRASLVALPSEMRVQYAEKMSQLLPANSQILLIAFNYAQHEMQGPPFSVSDLEIAELFEKWCERRLLYNQDISDKEPHFRQRGVTHIFETVHILTVN